MKSEQAIWISDCLKEVDGIKTDWRAIKKFADDWERKK